MKKKARRRLLLLVIIVILALLFIQSDWITEKLYPIVYKDIIADNAVKYDVDPHLIAAVIRVESNFKLGRESPKGAVGLMQLMPTTADWIIERLAKKATSSEELKYDPDLNIELGTWYLRHLLSQFDGNMVISIAAYNAGPGNVNRWLKDDTWDGHYDNVENIPFGETRNYVQKVIYYYNKYKELYPELT